jgi:hypothetical protein
MTAWEERWRLGKKDKRPRSLDAAPGRKITIREPGWPSGNEDGRPGSQKTGPEAKKAAGNPQKAFGKLQTGPGILKKPPGWRKRWPGREKRSRRASRANVQESGLKIASCAPEAPSAKHRRSLTGARAKDAAGPLHARPRDPRSHLSRLRLRPAPPQR